MDIWSKSQSPPLKEFWQIETHPRVTNMNEVGPQHDILIAMCLSFEKDMLLSV